MSKRGVDRKRPKGAKGTKAPRKGKRAKAPAPFSKKPFTALDKSILTTEGLSQGQKAVLIAFPVRNDKGLTWKENGDGTVTLRYKKNFGRFERWLFTKVGGTEYLNVPLDEVGSFLWRGCDGRHTIAQLCMAADLKFKERVEPVVPRVMKFFELLLRRNLVALKGRDMSEVDEGQK